MLDQGDRLKVPGLPGDQTNLGFLQIDAEASKSGVHRG